MAYKQHFVEWFSGKQLPSYWYMSGDNGSAMDTKAASTGGYELKTFTSANANCNISFNGKRPFDLASSTFHAVASKGQLLSTRSFYVGLSHHNVIGVDANNTQPYAFKSTSTGSSTLHYVNGELRVTKTTNNPTGVGQPSFVIGANSGVFTTGNIRYFEAYNT